MCLGGLEVRRLWEKGYSLPHLGEARSASLKAQGKAKVSPITQSICLEISRAGSDRLAHCPNDAMA